MSQQTTNKSTRGWWSILDGAVAGAASRTASAPIDLLKIRFQIQSSTRRQYIGILQACRTILKEEGPKAFWKGNVAGIYLYAVYSSVQFSVYEQLISLDPLLRNRGWFVMFGGQSVFGACSALVATLLSYPFDLIRTRHALQKSQNRAYGSIWHTTSVILREESVMGLYKGLLPSLAQVMPYMGLVFATYHQTKATISSSIHSPTLIDLVAGAVSGFTSKLLLMPVDVLRKRLQVQGSHFNAYVIENVPRYHGAPDCIRTIWRIEGLRGFYSGLSLALLKSVPATTVTFVAYGLLRQLHN